MYLTKVVLASNEDYMVTADGWKIDGAVVLIALKGQFFPVSYLL